jgi:hypothetical protein
MKYSKITYTKGEQDFAKNCLKLARILETQVPDKYFDMRIYAEQYDCNTIGCALGWAAMSNQFPGLQYQLLPNHEVQPVFNGETCFWPNVGPLFFGKAYYGIMIDTSARSPKQVAKELRQWAKENAT